MRTQAAKPYWIDELMRKHEGYAYEDAEAHILTIEHEGRSLRLFVQSMPPIDVRVTASAGELLFLLGERREGEGWGRRTVMREAKELSWSLEGTRGWITLTGSPSGTAFFRGPRDY